MHAPRWSLQTTSRRQSVFGLSLDSHWRWKDAVCPSPDCTVWRQCSQGEQASLNPNLHLHTPYCTLAGEDIPPVEWIQGPIEMPLLLFPSPM